MLFARTKACLLTGYWAETQTWEITNTSTEVNSCVYEQHIGDTPSTSVIVDSDYEMKSVPQTEHLGSAASVYKTELRWYEWEGKRRVITQSLN